MIKIFAKKSEKYEFKALETQISQGRSQFVIRNGLLWAVVTTAFVLLIRYITDGGVTPTTLIITIITYSVVSIRVGSMLWKLACRRYANLQRRFSLSSWGVGIFDDDIPLEIITSAIDQGQSLEALIERALCADSLQPMDRRKCHEIIVASAMSNAVLNDINYNDIDDLVPWLRKQDRDVALASKDALIKSLEAVLEARSELAVLWSKKVDLYPAWRGNIHQLIDAQRDVNGEAKKPLPAV